MILDYIGRLISHKSLHSPILVVGASRSGTSVLLQALGKHRQLIDMPGEAPFLTSIGGNASVLDGDNGSYYRESLKLTTSEFYEALAKFGIETAGGKHYALKQYIKTLFIKKAFCTHWCAKTFPPKIVAVGLQKVYPEVKFIHIIRNGIDVVHSMTKFSGFKHNNFEDQCRTWNDNIQKYKYLFELSNALVVFHEELLESPDIFFQSIFNFLNVTYEQGCIDYVKSTLVHPLDKANQLKTNALQELQQRESPFHSWSSEQQDIFTTICAQTMLDVGYAIPTT